MHSSKMYLCQLHHLLQIIPVVAIGIVGFYLLFAFSSKYRHYMFPTHAPRLYGEGATFGVGLEGEGQILIHFSMTKYASK